MRRCKTCHKPMFGKEAKYCSPGCNPSNTLQRAFREKFASTGANFNNAQHRKILRDPVGYLLIHAKSNAKQSGVEFDLTREDIKIPARCPVLGRFLKFHFAPKGGRRGPSWDSISLDRIDPSKGYVRGNVRVVSMRANHLKSDASVEEFIAVCEDLLRLHKKGWPLGDQVC